MRTALYSVFGGFLINFNLADPSGQGQGAMQASIYRQRSLSYFRLLGMLLAGILFLFAAPAQALNFVTNDNFIAGTDPWKLRFAAGGAGTLTNANGWGRGNITAGGSTRGSVGIEQTFREPLLNGVTYTIAFDLIAEAPKTIDVVVFDSSRAIIGDFHNIPAETKSARRTLTYTHTQPDAADAILSFHIGGNATDVGIDNVVFARQGSPSQLLARKPDGTWSFPTVKVGGKSWNAGTYDFSYAGYIYGERDDFIDIPSATRTISAVNNEDITDKLNAALAALPNGGTVIIPAGTFRIGAGKTNNAVSVGTDNTVIKGAGMGVTLLKVDPTYHVASQASTFSYGVIAFTKPKSSNWFYGGGITTATETVLLGARAITVADASAFSVGDAIVIRQVMWKSFVEQYAYNDSLAVYDASLAAKPWRWTNYDANNNPLFNNKNHSFRYYRKVVSKNGNTLSLDVPIPHELNPVNMPVSVGGPGVVPLRNCGMQDLTLTADPEDGVDRPQSSLGTTIMIGGLVHGLFKNVAIDSFRSLGFATNQSVNISFINCVGSNGLNGGEGGAGYAFYIKGQNLLYKNCLAFHCGAGFTSAGPTGSNIVIKNCRSKDYRWNPDRTSGQQVDDTHVKFAHGILWDNHYSKEAGMLMVNRGTLSGAAYETCGWSIVWNAQNEGWDTKSSTGVSFRHNYLGLTPAEFGMVIGPHAGNGPAGISVRDGYRYYPSSSKGVAVRTSTNLQVGTAVNRVLYEYTGQPVAESLYDIQFAQRAKLLP